MSEHGVSIERGLGPRGLASLNAPRRALAAAHEGLPRSVARVWVVRCELDFEELCSIGQLKLVQAAIGFDETSGSRFEAYARVTIDHGIIDELRRRCRGEGRPVSAEALREAGHELGAKAEGSCVFDREALDPYGIGRRAGLSVVDQEMLMLLARGLTYRQVAGIVRVPLGTVKSRMSRIQRMLRERSDVAAMRPAGAG